LQGWENDPVKSDSLSHETTRVMGKERIDSHKMLTIEVLPYHEITMLLSSLYAIPSAEKMAFPSTNVSIMKYQQRLFNIQLKLEHIACALYGTIVESAGDEKDGPT
jgi:hypothetical protein